MIDKKQAGVLVIVVIVCTLTIPRLAIGYGMDGDAARGAKAAGNLLTTGAYRPSRLPGNPLFEYVLVVLSPWGPIASNLFVLFSHAVNVFMFSFLCAGRNKSALLRTLYALTPILLVNAASTMDYIPGLALMLCSYALLSQNKYALAAAALALSIGCRLSNIMFMLPLVLYSLVGRQVRGTIVFALAAFLGGIAFYVPILARYGLSIFSVLSPRYGAGSHFLRLSYNAMQLFGPLATVGIIILAVTKRETITTAIGQRLKRGSPALVVEVMTVFLFVLLFAIHPDEPSYLIPIVPFVYLLLSRFFSTKDMVLVTILVLSFSFATLELKGGESGSRTITAKPSWGIVIKDYIERKELELLRVGIGCFDESTRAVILTGMGPILTYRNNRLARADYAEISPRLLAEGIWEQGNIHRVSGRDVYLVYAVSKENVSLLHEEGFDIYIFSRFAPSVAITKYHYNPYDLGIKKLSIMDENSFYNGGG